MSEHLCTILWEVAGKDSLEYCTCTQTEDGYQFSGVLVMSQEGQPLRVDYAVLCDPQWRTRQVDVSLTSGAQSRSLRLTVVMYPTFQLFLVPILLIGFAGVLAFPGVEPADRILPYILTQVSLSHLFQNQRRSQ